MAFTKGVPITGFAFGIVHKETGSPVTTGTVNTYITKDGGVQQAGSYTPVHEGNGQWTINLSGNEMDADVVGLIVIHADAIPQHFTIKTEPPVADEDIITITATSSGTTISGEFEFYGSMVGAINYFSKKLNTNAWDDALYEDREASLIQATIAIDRLNFLNNKTSSSQNLQFPRGTDITIPVEIEYACYEVALSLLDGVDMEQEAQTVGVMSESHSGVRTTYDESYVNEHLRAGIPSIQAWGFLKPFLRDPLQLRVSRVT